MIATIGYEKAQLPDFVRTLVACEIDILIDIRDRAQSRRPGFSKSALSAAVGEVGIEYVHYKQLGDPKEGRDAARAGNLKLFQTIFLDVMKTDAAQEALMEVKELAENHNICLMCYERDQRECHRKIVADQLEAMLSCKAKHIGVQKFASKPNAERRVFYPHQSTAA
jgi:uncharacterized protein (DUF488 family)